MKRLLLLALLLGAPVQAQQADPHAGHAMPAEDMPALPGIGPYSSATLPGIYPVP